MGVKFDTRRIRGNLKKLDRETKSAITAIVDRQAAMGEGHMKTTAPWTDRTGAARSGLFTLAEHSGSKHKIIFSHSVHYGIWLDVKNSGRYEVILPSIRHTGANLMSELNHLFGRI
jgi:hypothetical protein